MITQVGSWKVGRQARRNAGWKAGRKEGKGRAEQGRAGK